MFKTGSEPNSTTAVVRLDLRGEAPGQLSFDAPISCKLELRYVTYGICTGHQYSVVPPRDGAAGMAHFCNQRLYKSIWVWRDANSPSAYAFKDAPADSVPLPMQVQP